MERNSNTAQCRRIMDYMKQHGSITQYEALNDLGVMRLASRIHELRRAGVLIVGTDETVKNSFGETCRYTRYRLKDTERE